jgi:hypothetical protein
MLSNTNTNRYANGVPNILAYLEGYSDIASYNNTEAMNNYYVLQGRENNFPVQGLDDDGKGKADSVQVLQYLGLSTVWEKKSNPAEQIANTKDYPNVMAVLNDTVANYDVVFTFQTATQPVMDAAEPDVGKSHPQGIYDAEKGNKVYMSFNQHLYGSYGNDSTYTPFGSAYFTAPVNYNLFTGGLIVNDYYSMQLADTTMFSYSATTLSFNYNDVKSNAYANYNSWMDYIQSLRLATSAEWYWDNMSVTWAAPVADTAESGAGTRSDDFTF